MVLSLLATGATFATACADDPASSEKDPVTADDDGDDDTEDDDTEDDEPDASKSVDASTKKPDAKVDAAAPKKDAATDAGTVVDANFDASQPDASTTKFPPFETNGEPLKATDKQWTYVEFPESSCRDGSKAGIGISLNSASKKVMIYLEGGGACFDSGTCGVNPSKVGTIGDKRNGIFDRSNAQNPVKDWNHIYVPYCTGDTHGGANPDGNVPGVGPQKFVGYLNMQKFLNRIVPTFPDADDVLLTGVSAGGFGSAQNAVLVQRAFPNVKVKSIDDSGPPLSKAVVAECLQEKWRTLWKLDETFLKDCGDACPNKNDYTQDYGLFLAKTFNDRPSGLIESAQDGTIALFMGPGANNCMPVLPFPLAPAIPGPAFQADLLAFRDKVKPYPSFSTYIPSGTTHTWLGGNGLYTGSAGGTKLIDWVTKIVNGENPGHVGP